MAYRKRIKNKRRDKNTFSRTAMSTHKKNTGRTPSRGGIRL